MKRTIYFLLTLTFLIYGVCFGLIYDQLPSGLPSGLKTEIKGNYRIIEHSANKDAWTVYDAKSWKKVGDGIVMNPPVYRYEYEGKGKWSTYLHEIPVKNIFREDLVTIMNAQKTKQQQNKEHQAKATDNLPAIPLKSQEAYYKLIRAIMPMKGNNYNAPPEERARFFYNHYVNNYRRAGYSFEKSIISWAKAYKKNPHFHSESQYANTPARPMWGDVHFFSESLEDFPFKKFFSKEAYEALVTVEKVDKWLQGKRIE